MTSKKQKRIKKAKNRVMFGGLNIVRESVAGCEEQQVRVDFGLNFNETPDTFLHSFSANWIPPLIAALQSYEQSEGR
jgi:hypothetical protein